MDEHRFVAWDAQGRPLRAFPGFDTAHLWAHQGMRQPRTSLPLTLDDRTAKISRRASPARCGLVSWVEFAVPPSCDLVALSAAGTGGAQREPAACIRV